MDNAHLDLKIIDNLEENQWINVETEQIGNLKEEGVIDPTSVAITSLTNALSVAGIFLTTECAIIKQPKKETINEENLL